MPQKTVYEAQIGPHRYQVQEKRREKGYERANWRQPVRSTSFKGITPNAPGVTPIKSHSIAHLKAPITYQQMTPQERKEQQLRNAALAATGGVAGGFGGRKAQQFYEGVKGRTKPKEADIAGNYRRVLREIEHRIDNPAFDPQTPAEAQRMAPEVERIRRTHPVYGRMKKVPKRLQRHGSNVEELAAQFGDIRFGVKPKAVAREAVRSRIGWGIGAGLGAGLGAAKIYRDRGKPKYRAEYSTEGMQPLQTRRLH